MSASRPLPTNRNLFLFGYTGQQEWAWLIAAAFFLGKIGAGLFLISIFLEFSLGALVGLLIVALGKTAAHLLFLGRPERFWRAIVHWRTSRISQGLVAMGVFIVCGAVYLVLNEAGAPSAAVDTFGVIAAVAAVVLMFYDGLVLNAARGIAAWDSWLLPVLALFYSLLGGTTLTLALRALSGSEASEAELHWMQISLLGMNLILVGIYVFTVQIRSAAAQFAVQMLTRGRLSFVFLAGAVGIGLVGTFAFAVLAVATDSQAALAVAAVMDLLGHFLIFFAILRVGIYAPLRSVPLRGSPAAGSA